MKNYSKQLIIAALTSIGSMLGIANVNAQNFITGANSSYVVPTGLAEGNGVIMMHGKTSEIQGKYGLSEANRMPGTVIWTCLQTIKGGTFYTNLGTTGTAVKTFGPGTIDISGKFTPDGTGNHNYTGSEIKLSSNIASVTQSIPRATNENGTGYDVLTLVGASPKEIPIGGKILVNGSLTQTGGVFTNKGDIVFAHTGTTSSLSDFNNEPTGSHLSIISGGTVTFDKLTNTSGSLIATTNSVINLNGTFTHVGGIINLACNSTTNYTGSSSQTIVPNGATFPSYGNLSISNSAKIAGGNISVCNDYVGNSELDMAPGANDYTLTLLNSTNGNHASYTNGAEVRGKMVYAANLAAGTEYIFNNANTKVTFEGATVPTKFGFDIRQATAPNTMVSDFDATKDISRKIGVIYAGTGKISSFKTMWEVGDELGGFIPLTATTASSLKLAEGYDASKVRKKIIRVGASFNVDHSNRTITYAGGGAGADGINLVSGVAPSPITVAANKALYNGSDILMSILPQKVVSVTNGRWSNPGTWDSGVEPGPMDIVSIVNKVWVGDNDALFGASAYTTSEKSVTDGTTAAKSITIENVSGAGLYIGNNDANMRKDANNFVVFKTVMSGNETTGIFNLNENANTSTDPKLNNGTGFNGIWIATVTSTYKPVLGGSQFIVNGSMVNNSTAEVGECQP